MRKPINDTDACAKLFFQDSHLTHFANIVCCTTHPLQILNKFATEWNWFFHWQNKLIQKWGDFRNGRWRVPNNLSNAEIYDVYCTSKVSWGYQYYTKEYKGIKGEIKQFFCQANKAKPNVPVSHYDCHKCFKRVWHVVF